MTEEWNGLYERAVDDPELQKNVLAFQRRWRGHREHAFDGRDFQALRQELASIKNDVIARQPHYLDQFKRAAEQTGAVVYAAESAEDATRYVIELARSRGVGTVIKSKSIVSEEVGLNEALERAGIRPVESDVGEWIIQLAHERPSHIVAPAIHKNRRQVADLFSAATGRPVDREDVDAQLAVARETLRAEFFAAGMGISGANAIVAESGTVLLVTNEGNAELTTTLPRIHVVLVGIEKLVPTLDAAMLQLELLAPSATGQRATTYVSAITGPADGEGEMHIVLIDNGRSAMRSSPHFVEALRCIRCGACANVCPSYAVVGGHVFGYVYAGAIGLVNTPFHSGLGHDAGPQSLCVSCNACQTVCPVDIPLPRQILDVRAWVAREEGLPLVERAVLRLWSHRRIAHAGLRLGARLTGPLRSGPFLNLPGPAKLTSWRKLPAPATRPFRDQPLPLDPDPLDSPAGSALTGLTVGYFVQCLTDWLYPEMGAAVVEVLRSLGAAVVFPRSQHCCGLPAYDAGDRESARRMARQTIRVLEGCDADYIVSGGTSCVIAMLHEYRNLFLDEPEWQTRAERQATRLFDFTTFLDRVAQLPPGALPGAARSTATYHYFCQAHNVLGQDAEPSRLLRDVCGVNLETMPEATVCCGFGGSVSFRRPEMARHILARTLGNVDETAASVIITDNPGCIMNLRGGAVASGRTLQVRHTAEVVADRIRTIRRTQST